MIDIKQSGLIACFWFFTIFIVLAGCIKAESPEYGRIQTQLQNGWNTWDSRSVIRHVLLPQGLAVNISFKQQRWLDERFLDRALIGAGEKEAPLVRPGLHSYNGSYTDLEISWQDLTARIQSTRLDEDLLILIEPKSTPKDPVKLVVSLGMLWNRPGHLGRSTDELTADLDQTRVTVQISGPEQTDYYVPLQTPYLVIQLAQATVISSGRKILPLQAKELLARARQEMIDRSSRYAKLGESLLAIESAIAWNTVYEPRHQRVVSTVGRLWNEEYGGYCLFGWDNFFLAYMCALNNRDLALANIIEHLNSRTDEGFIPNDDRGNGSKSFDRSQPPVGAIIVKEIYKRFPERWLLEEAFPVLLNWNRWWIKRRLNKGLLSYGSHKTANPYNEPHVGTIVTAGYESGMDDSPMYEGVIFNEKKQLLELQDVGLNSLYIADCHALEEMGLLLGRQKEAAELRQRGREFSRALETLWSPADYFYLNRHSDSGQFSKRLSPTLFYPLLTGKIPKKHAAAMLLHHFYNPQEFYGQWLLPSISRNDPAFPRQRYWKGAVWPPLNFLCYLGLRLAGQMQAAGELALKSSRLFLQEWHNKGYVSENYSAITGTGDDKHLSSDRFHSWGALMGIMAFIEAGKMPRPEASLDKRFDLEKPEK